MLLARYQMKTHYMSFRLFSMQLTPRCREFSVGFCRGSDGNFLAGSRLQPLTEVINASMIALRAQRHAVGKEVRYIVSRKILRV